MHAAKQPSIDNGCVTLATVSAPPSLSLPFYEVLLCFLLGMPSSLPHAFRKSATNGAMRREFMKRIFSAPPLFGCKYACEKSTIFYRMFHRRGSPPCSSYNFCRLPCPARENNKPVAEFLVVPQDFFSFHRSFL